jgi:signal transduction histidine kinase
LAAKNQVERDMARIRATVATIIIVAGLLAVVEAWMASALGSRSLWLLAVATGLFAFALLHPLRLNARGQAGRAVFLCCLAILGIQCAYLLLFPRAYPAISIASIVVVALALSFVRGRALFGVVVASWALAVIAIVWGILGPASPAVPAEAELPILLGSGLAAVTVGMVLLWQFASHMTRTLEESRAANVELSAANEALKGLQELKSRFINSAAHELNTPLTPVLLQLQILKRNIPESDAPQRRSLLVVERNLNRISGLVREMLEVARLQAGRLEFKRETVDLAALVQEAVTDFSAIAEEAGVALLFSSQGSMPTVADRRHVEQILSNLLSNAIRLTPRGGAVAVTLASEGGMQVVRVTDTGLGLSPEQIAGLFQPFARLHDESVAGKGSGLGLHISRALAVAMGGHLRAESPGAGKGATFILTIPAAIIEPGPSPAG